MKEIPLPSMSRDLRRSGARKGGREREGEPEVITTFAQVKVFNAQGRVWRRWKGSLL